MERETPDGRPLVITASEMEGWSDDLVGDKGLGLLRMSARHLPVPPFFVLTTAAWTQWRRQGLSETLRRVVSDAIEALEPSTGSAVAAGTRPRRVALRSSRPASLPALTGPVLDVGGAGPPGGWDELWTAIQVTFESWCSPRAERYRKLHRLGADAGIAIVVQAMAEAAAGITARGVVHSRGRADGSNTVTGHWASVQAGDGADAARHPDRPWGELREWSPSVFEQLTEAARAIERIEHGPQAVDFVVGAEESFSLLQRARLDVGPVAASRIYLDMAAEGLLSGAEAAARLASLPLDDLDTEELVTPGPCIATGSAASPGVGSGICVRDSRDAATRAGSGIDVVLVRPETSPNDVPAMKTARAIVTERGGELSHAAIFSREFQVPCVVGCGPLEAVTEGAELTVNGSTGEVFLGRHTPVRATPPAVERARAFLRAQGAGGRL